MKDMRKEIETPRKVALYMYTAGSTGAEPWYSVAEVQFSNYGPNYQPLPDGEVREMPRENFTRVSDLLEITFQPLSNDEVVQNAVAALNEAERKTIEELNKKLMEIRGRKAQLLALTYSPETV